MDQATKGTKAKQPIAGLRAFLPSLQPLASPINRHFVIFVRCSTIRIPFIPFIPVKIFPFTGYFYENYDLHTD